MDDRISYFARTNARHPQVPFGIKQADRLFHLYLIGKTGVGKSTLLETLIGQDIAAGRGCALIDPHGDLVARVHAAVPENFRDQVVYLDATDPGQPYGYTPLPYVVEERRSLVASGLLEVLKKIWDDSWGVRMEHILRNAILTLLAQKDATLPDLLRLLIDKSYRSSALLNVTNPQVKAFWTREYDKYSWRYRADGIAPIQNKVGAFLADPALYRLFTRRDNRLRLRRVMDQQQVLLVNLAKGVIGEDSATLLGGLLVTSLGLAALSRADLPEADRTPFHLYVDEFQTFTTLSIATMLAELRKFGVSMTLAHQYLYQLEPDIRHAVLGNAGTMIAFRLGAKDAAYIARELEPVFDRVDLLNLPNYDIYVKLMIDGTPSRPFSATTLRAVELGK